MPESSVIRAGGGCRIIHYSDSQHYRHIVRFLDEVYTHKRIHSSLGYLTPVEFKGQWLATQFTAGEVK